MTIAFEQSLKLKLYSAVSCFYLNGTLQTTCQWVVFLRFKSILIFENLQCLEVWIGVVPKTNTKQILDADTPTVPQVCLLSTSNKFMNPYNSITFRRRIPTMWDDKPTFPGQMENHTKVLVYHQNQRESDKHHLSLYLGHLQDEQTVQEPHHLPKHLPSHRPADRNAMILMLKTTF